MNRILIHLIIFFSFVSISSFSHAAGYIEVTAPGNRLLKLAVVPPQPAGASINYQAANEMADAQTFDLTMSGIFNAERKDSAPLKQGLGLSPVDFIPWLTAGYDFLIRGEYDVRGEELTVEFRLFDVLNKKQLLVKRYLGKMKEYRRYAHAFSDEVLLVMAGEKGPFTARLAFASLGGSKEIYIMDWDGYNLQQITKNGGINLGPSISPDGREVLFTSYKKGNPDTYKRALSSSVDVPLSSRPGVNITAAWSPDGSSIALALSKDGNTELYRVRRDGSAPVRLTVTHAANLSPSWSPDGSKIAFVSDRLGGPQIFIMDATGGNVRRLTTSGKYNVNPAWSPKGDKIAFARMSGGFQIFVVNVDGTGETQLTTEGSNEHPSWSPDGRLIAYSSNKGGAQSIYVMRADGSGQTRVSRSSIGSRHPVWSPRWQ